jgi:hypothetical protein
MDGSKKRPSLLAFVGSMLLLVLLAALASTSWATPAQLEGDTSDTIPDKFCYDENGFVARGESTEFEILVNHPISPTDTWYNTVITDNIDLNLEVTGVDTTRGNATWTDHTVTFTLGTMVPGDSATLNVDVTVNDDAPQGYDVYNTAYMSHVGWSVASSDTWMCRIAYEQRLPLAMRRYQ